MLVEDIARTYHNAYRVLQFIEDGQAKDIMLASIVQSLRLLLMTP